MDNGKKKGNETATELSLSPGSALGHTQSSERQVSASSGERDALAPTQVTEELKERKNQLDRQPLPHPVSQPDYASWVDLLKATKHIICHLHLTLWLGHGDLQIHPQSWLPTQGVGEDGAWDPGLKGWCWNPRSHWFLSMRPRASSWTCFFIYPIGIL